MLVLWGRGYCRFIPYPEILMNKIKAVKKRMKWWRWQNLQTHRTRYWKVIYSHGFFPWTAYLWNSFCSPFLWHAEINFDYLHQSEKWLDALKRWKICTFIKWTSILIQYQKIRLQKVNTHTQKRKWIVCCISFFPHFKIPQVNWNLGNIY